MLKDVEKNVELRKRLHLLNKRQVLQQRVKLMDSLKEKKEELESFIEKVNSHEFKPAIKNKKKGLRMNVEQHAAFKRIVNEGTQLLFELIDPKDQKWIETSVLNLAQHMDTQKEILEAIGTNMRALDDFRDLMRFYASCNDMADETLTDDLSEDARPLEHSMSINSFEQCVASTPFLKPN